MAKVIYSRNPINPREEILVKEFFKEVSISEIIDDMKIDTKSICLINNKYDENLNTSLIVGSNDVVCIQAICESDDTLKVVADIIQLAAVIVASVYTGGAASAAYIKAGILIGGSLISAGIRSQIAKKSLSDVNGISRSESPTYSLSASGNSARPYQSFPLLLGNHVFYPDYLSSPYEELFVEVDKIVKVVKVFDVISNPPLFPFDIPLTGWFSNFSSLLIPPEMSVRVQEFLVYIKCVFNNTWEIDPISFEALENFESRNFGEGLYPIHGPLTNPKVYPTGNFDFFDVNGPPDTVNSRRPIVVRITSGPNNGEYWYYADIIESMISLQPTGPVVCIDWTVTNLNTNPLGLSSQNINNINRGQRFIEVEDSLSPGVFQLQHHFSFGFGDLRIDDRRFGNTNIKDLRELLVSQPNKTPTSWKLSATHALQNIVVDTVTSYTEENFNFGNNIDESIFNHVVNVEGAQLINNNAFPYPQNWIIREGPEKTKRIEVSLTGRLFGIGDNGYKNISFAIEAQYRIADTGNTWINFGAGNFTYSSSSSNQFSEEISLNVPIDKYDIRLRMISKTNSEENGGTIEIQIKAIKFYKEVDQEFVGVNQEFVSVRASEQLNGQLDRYSAHVYASCYDWNRVTKSWTWKESSQVKSNPASWFLYFALGAWKNETKNGVGVFPDSPTIGWGMNRNDPNNKYRLFGAGVSIDRIDLDCIQSWHEFCEDTNLNFNAVIDKNQTAAEVLDIIANVGRGSVTWQSGGCKLGVTYEDPNQVPINLYNEFNIKAGSFQIMYQNSELPEEVQVHYVNPENDWTQDSVFAIRPDLIGGATDKRVTVDLLGVTNKNQAQREANLLAAKQLYLRSLIKFKTDIESMIVSRGDIIQIGHNLGNFAYSGRPYLMETDGVNITKLFITTEIEVASGFLHVRNPDGEIKKYQASFSGKEITILEPWSLVDAPFYLDENYKNENPSSAFSDCCVYDWLLQAGPEETPGKRARITGIDFLGYNEIEITCVDDDPAYYANEFVQSYVLPENTTKLKTKAFNICHEVLNNGNVKISFELEGTDMAKIYYYVDSTGPFNATFEGQSAFGTSSEYELSFPKGKIKLTVEPIAIGVPFSSESSTIEFVL